MIVNTFKHVEVCAPLSFLAPILTTWVDRMEQVSRSFPQARDSYYLEQTLVSLLSGSAWAHGMAAITEVKIQRAAPGAPNRGGRLDLSIQHGQQLLALEAKLMWAWELRPDSVRGRLQTACADVVSMAGNRANIRLGGVFFVPWWDNDWQKDDLAVRVLDPYKDLQLDIKTCCYDPAQDFPGAMFLAQRA